MRFPKPVSSRTLLSGSVLLGSAVLLGRVFFNASVQACRANPCDIEAVKKWAQRAAAFDDAATGGRYANGKWKTTVDQFKSCDIMLAGACKNAPTK